MCLFQKSPYPPPESGIKIFSQEKIARPTITGLSKQKKDI